MYTHCLYLYYFFQYAHSDYVVLVRPCDCCVTQVRLILQIFELLEQSKGCDTLAGEGEGRDEFEEELANLVTGGGLQPTRSYVNRRLNVYYSALRACGDLGNIEVGGHDN